MHNPTWVIGLVFSDLKPGVRETIQSGKEIWKLNEVRKLEKFKIKHLTRKRS